MDIIQKLILSLTIIYLISGNIQKQGTGFFWTNDRDEVYLITNKHVIFKDGILFNDTIFIKLHKYDNLDELEFFKVLLLDENNEPNYLLHSDTSVDIVAIKINEQQRVEKKLYITTISKDNVLSSDLIYPIGSNVNVIGYPLGFYDTETENQPIAISGEIASNINSKFKGESIFFLNGKFNEGLSGSPVFTKISKTFETTIGNRMYMEDTVFFLGIFSAELEYTNDTTSAERLNLGIVWNPNYIEEILKSDN